MYRSIRHWEMSCCSRWLRNPAVNEFWRNCYLQHLVIGLYSYHRQGRAPDKSYQFYQLNLRNRLTGQEESWEVYIDWQQMAEIRVYLYGYVTSSQLVQLPIWQLVEHCHWNSQKSWLFWISFKPEFFVRFWVHNCDDRSCFYIFLVSSNVWPSLLFTCNLWFVYNLAPLQMKTSGKNSTFGRWLL